MSNVVNHPAADLMTEAKARNCRFSTGDQRITNRRSAVHLGAPSPHTVSVAKKATCLTRDVSGLLRAISARWVSRGFADAAPNPGQGLMVIWAWRRALFAFRRAGCQAVHLID